MAGEEPLLRRLLRRRADEPAPDAQAPAIDPDAAPRDIGPGEVSAEAVPTTQEESGARIDPYSGKPVDELTDADLPPLESLGPGSDFSGFLGRNISPALRQRALRQLFHQPQFNTICLCAEYAEDYNNFTALGDIVPHDLTRQLGVQAERMARKLLAAEEADAEATQAAAIARKHDGETLVRRDTTDDATKVVSGSPGSSSDSGKARSG